MATDSDIHQSLQSIVTIFEVFTAVTMKNAVFWDVMPCGSCLRRLLVTVNIVHISPILVTLTMEALSSFETSVLSRATRSNIPEDGIPNSDHHLRLLFSADVDSDDTVSEALVISLFSAFA
jgi:hypothetical protein